MRHFYVSLLVVINTVLSSLGQKEIKYLNPPAILGDGYNIEVDDIIATESVCKLQVIIKNQQPDAFLIYNLQQSAFSFENLGKFYEKKQKSEVIPPLKKESFVVRTTGNDYRKPSFTFHPEGLWSASMQVNPLVIKSTKINTGSIEKLSQDGVNINLNSSIDKKGITQVVLEVKLEEAIKDQLLIIDPTQIKLLDDKGDLISTDFKRDKLLGLLAGTTKKSHFHTTQHKQQQLIGTKPFAYLLYKS